MTSATRVPPSGARVLGAVGVSLLLAAALSVVSARWELFGPGARLATLIAASAALVVVTRFVRRLAPSTAQLLDVLVAAMLPIDTAAAVIVTGGSWPAALVGAGPVAAVVGVALRTRALPLVGDATIVVGGVLTAAGVAAQFGMHGPLLLAGMALAFAGLAVDPRDRWVAAGWAVLAGLAPAGRLFDEVVFTGMGTLREMGLLEPASLPETVAAGGLASLCVAIAAARERSHWLAAVALGVAATTALETWALADPPRHIGLLAVAALVGLVELGDLRRLPVARETVDELRRINEAALVLLTALVAAGSWTLLVDEPGVIAETPLTAGVIAAAWIVGQAHRGRAVWAPALPGFVVAASAAAHLTTDDPRVLGGALLGGALLAIAFPRGGSTTLALVAVVLAPFASTVSGDAAAIAVTAWVAIALAVFALRRDPAADEPLLAAGVAAILTHGVLGAGAGVVAWTEPFAISAVAGLWWSAGLLLHRLQPAAGIVLRTLALMGPLVLMADAPGAALALASTVSIGAAVEFRLRPSIEQRTLLAAALTVAWSTTLRALDVELIDVYVVSLTWIAVTVAVHAGAARRAAHLLGLAVTTIVSVAGRLDDGLAVHTAVLGAVAVVVAVLAGRAGDRTVLAVAAPVAIGAATFDLLDRSVGVESWGWLLIGGAVAVSGAVVLERRDADPSVESSVG